ncbi:hypothetical protein GIB67_005773, partial [Kingdonia uniflora]
MRILITKWAAFNLQETHIYKISIQPHYTTSTKVLHQILTKIHIKHSTPFIFEQNPKITQYATAV